MRSRLSITLHVATGCLVLCGFAALTSIREYPNTLLLLPLAALLFMPLGERLDLRYGSYRVMSNAVTIAFGCFLPLLFLSLGLLYTVIGLVFYIICFLLVHRKTERAYYYIFLMTFFLLLAASVQSPEPIVGLVLAAYLVSAVWCFSLVRLYFDLHGGLVPESKDGRQFALRSAGTDMAPIRGPGAPRRPQFDSVIAAGLFVLGFAAIGLTGLIFVATPRIEAGILGRGDIPMAQTGISDSVDLTGGAYIQQDMTIVMRVEFPDGHSGLEAPFYWRITTLPSYRDALWSRRSIREHYQADIEPLFPENIQHQFHANPHEIRRTRRTDTRIVHQRIFMDDVPEEGVPALDLVQSIGLPGQPRNTRLTWGSGHDFTVTLSRSGLRQLNYEAYSEVYRPAPDTLREASMDYSFLREADYELLTYHDLLPETVSLTENVVGGADNLYDMAQAVSAYLSGPEFFYTLDVPPLAPDHAIDHFVNEVRMGHCELFASAMALMLRSQGIPTRVVLGYMGGEWSESEEAFVVRASMAHLWVEVLFPEFGWVRFDPSPRGDDDLGGAWNSLARQLSLLSLRAKMFWYQDVVGFDSATQWDRLRDFTLSWIPDFTVVNEETGVTEGYRIPYPVMALGGVLCALAACFYVFVWRRRDPGHVVLLTADQDRAAKLYRALRRRLYRAGLRDEHATAEEIDALLPKLPLLGTEHARLIIATYNASRFGMRPLDQGRYLELRKGLRTLRPLPQSS